MKKLLKRLCAIFLCISIMFPALSQSLDAEGTCLITGKSKRGTLGDVSFDANTGTYSLVYVTKSTDRKAKFQTYKFDNEFKFIEMSEDEIEYEKAKLKFSWFDWRGEEYSTEGMYIEPNLMGTLVLRKKRLTYKYDWLLLGYYIDVEILNKVKPKNEEGRKFHYYTHAEDDATGDVFILCGIKPIIKKGVGEWYDHMKKFVVLRYNKDVELVSEVSFETDYPVELAFARNIPGENSGVGGLTFVFAPTTMAGKKVLDPDNKNYQYVRINANNEIVDNVKFTSHNGLWKINELIYEPKSDAVYMIGPSLDYKGKYYNELKDSKEFGFVQLMKIKDHKVEFLTQTSIDEFEAKLKMPPMQKKPHPYKGEKFQFVNYLIGENGDFYVQGQNFKPSDKGTKYLDCIGFHFDSEGILKAQYSVDIDETNAFAKANATDQTFIENTGNGNMYWVIFEIKGVSMARGKMLSYPRIGKVDTDKAEIYDFVSFGADGKHFLDPTFPFLQTSEDNSLVFFGSDKKGKEIWFARVKLD